MPEQEREPQGGTVSKHYELKPGAPNYTPQTRDDEPGSTGGRDDMPEPEVPAQRGSEEQQRG